MPLNSLKNLFIEELQDLYSAETQLVDALPKMAQAASHDDLRKAFNEHLEETRGHVDRLERIFKNLDASPQGNHCEAMEGLISEGEEMINEQGEPEVKDAALISAAQRVEHYEMAGYGTLKTFAKRLDEKDAAKLLDETLSEEKAADKKLNKIAMGSWTSSGVNKDAEKQPAHA